MTLQLDPRWIEYGAACTAVREGLRAPPGAHERYRRSQPPYVELLAEQSPPHVRKHMMRALFEDGLALGVIAAGFRASEEEVGYVMEHPPVKPEPHDEIERLQALPYGVYLKTRHWLQVRDEALARADHRCALDNSTELLQVHHRTYDRRGCERPADVIVLCDPCHTRHHAQLRVA